MTSSFSPCCSQSTRIRSRLRAIAQASRRPFHLRADKVAYCLLLDESLALTAQYPAQWRIEMGCRTAPRPRRMAGEDCSAPKTPTHPPAGERWEQGHRADGEDFQLPVKRPGNIKARPRLRRMGPSSTPRGRSPPTVNTSHVISSRL
jgi:hypothetical protein